VDMTSSSATPDVTSDAMTRKLKHRQRVATKQSMTPDVASTAAVTSPVSAIERLDNLIKVNDKRDTNHKPAYIATFAELTRFFVDGM